MCGARIERNELRYVLQMSLFAAYDTLQIELTDLQKDYEDEIRDLVEKMREMDPKELEEDVVKQYSFDLCRRCQQKFKRNPLGQKGGTAESPEDMPPFDVDDFLRRLDGQ
jgi:hypothetical protein